MTFNLVNAQNSWDLEKSLNYLETIHNSVKIQNQEEKIIQQRLQSQKQNWIPRIDGSASHTYTFGNNINPITNLRESQNNLFNNFGLNIQSNLFDFETFKRIKSLKIEQDLVKIETQKIQYELKQKFILDFFQYFLSQSELNLCEKQIQNAQIETNWINDEVKIGTRAKSDEYQWSLYLEDLEIQKIALQNTIKNQKEELLYQLQIQEDSIDFIYDIKQELLLDFNTTKLKVVNAPELKRIQLENAQHSNEIKRLNSIFLPKIALNTGWNTFYASLSNQNNTNFSLQWINNQSYYVGFQMNVTLFSGRTIHHEKQIQKYIIEQNQLKHSQKEIDILRNIERIKQNYEQQLILLDKLKQREIVENKVNKNSKNKLQAGMISISEHIARMNLFEKWNNKVLMYQYNIHLQGNLYKYLFDF